jgi:hypothetical protein
MHFRGKDQQFSFEDYFTIWSQKKNSVLKVCFPAGRLTRDQERKYHLDVVPSLVTVALLNIMLIIRKTVLAALWYVIMLKL